jgi:hypothetical protein
MNISIVQLVEETINNGSLLALYSIEGTTSDNVTTFAVVAYRLL